MRVCSKHSIHLFKNLNCRKFLNFDGNKKMKKDRRSWEVLGKLMRRGGPRGYGKAGGVVLNKLEDEYTPKPEID